MNVKTAIISVNKSIAHVLNNLDDFLIKQEADQTSINRELESLVIEVIVTETGDTHNFSCVYAPINKGGEYNI